jgi:hypothetical protein
MLCGIAEDRQNRISCGVQIDEHCSASWQQSLRRICLAPDSGLDGQPAADATMHHAALQLGGNSCCRYARNTAYKLAARIASIHCWHKSPGSLPNWESLMVINVLGRQSAI